VGVFEVKLFDNAVQCGLAKGYCMLLAVLCSLSGHKIQALHMLEWRRDEQALAVCTHDQFVCYQPGFITASVVGA
jgi:hypothetical protein